MPRGKKAYEAYENKPRREDYHDSGEIDTSVLNERDRRFLESIKRGHKEYKKFAPDLFRADIYDYLSHVMYANETAEPVKRYTGHSYELVKKVKWVPTIEGFCIWAGYSRKGYYNHVNNPDFEELCEFLHDYCRSFVVEGMLMETLPAIPSIFTAKAVYGMVEAQPQTQPVIQQVNIIGADQIAQAFLDVKDKKQGKISAGETPQG